MEYRVQWSGEGTKQLSKAWGKAKGNNEEEAAVEYLRQIFIEVQRLSMVWIFVALHTPNHKNGMPMVVHGFKMVW